MMGYSNTNEGTYAGSWVNMQPDLSKIKKEPEVRPWSLAESSHSDDESESESGDEASTWSI